jgi:hypothetical protein
MTRLTLVVGQLRCVLVAGAVLISGCGDEDRTREGGVTSTVVDAAGPAAADRARDAPVALADVGTAGVADGGTPSSDGATDTRNLLRDAGRDSSRDGWTGDASALAVPPPEPWLARDIGLVSSKGEASATTTAFTVVSCGADIGGTLDSFHFLYQALAGDGEIVARVASLGGTTDPGSKAGVMMRAGLEPGAANVLLAVLGDPGLGGRLQHRGEAGGATTVMPADMAMKPGQYLRLARAGKTFTAFRSDNQATWTRIGSADVEMPATIYVGMATEAHSTSNAVHATYNYAALSSLASDPAAAPWEHLDVGTLGGTATQVDGRLTLTGYGDPFTLAQDYFTGVMQPMSGSHRLTVLLDAQSSAEPEARVGLMFREGLVGTASRSSAFAAISVSPGRGIQFHSRAVQGGLTTAGARKMEVKPPVWLRLEKSEVGALDRFTGWYSLDGQAWTMLDGASFSAAEPLLMGVVAGAGSAAAMNTGKVSHISVSPLAGSDGGATDVAPPADAGAGPDA